MDAQLDAMARDVLRVLTVHDNETGEHVTRTFSALVNRLESDAFERGFDLATNVATRETDRWAEMLLQVSAAMRGKGRADGPIDTTVYPDPVVYNWQPER